MILFCSHLRPRLVPLLVIIAIVGLSSRATTAFLTQSSSSRLLLPTTLGAEKDEKFGFVQRIDSAKSFVIAAVAGSVAQAPLSLILTSSLAQFEFDTDVAALSSGLFGIVYRYCVREDENPQLNQGVIGAFVLVRTLSRVQVSSSCSAVPLSCGPPLEYVNWDMLVQILASGATSAVLFGAAAYSIDRATRKGFLTKFPG